MEDLRKALQAKQKKFKKIKPPCVDLMVERQAAGLDIWTGLPLPSYKGGNQCATGKENGE